MGRADKLADKERRVRRFGVVHGVVLLLLGFACRGALAATPTLSQSLAALERQYQGRLGLAYIDSGSGWTVI